MEEKIRNVISGYYTNKVREFGPTPKGVDWNSEESQVMRFEQIAKILPVDTTTIFSLLDYGCGYGALFSFLKKERPEFTYTGYDISLEMLEESRHVITDEKASFCSYDNELMVADFVVASGIFNVKVDFDDDRWQAYILETLHRMNKLATRGLSFNLLTRYADSAFMKSYLYYADPGFFFDYCKKNFSGKVSLLHDYPLYEFTILVRK